MFKVLYSSASPKGCILRDGNGDVRVARQQHHSLGVQWGAAPEFHYTPPPFKEDPFDPEANNLAIGAKSYQLGLLVIIYSGQTSEELKPLGYHWHLQWRSARGWI